jgi:O-antigen ligase
MVFGAGINSFPVYISAADSTGMYPHNIILELLAEYGIIGTIFFTIPAVYVISIRKKILGSIYGNSIDEKIIFLLFVYHLAIHLFSGGLRYSWVLIFYLFLLLPSQNNVQIYYKKTKENVICPYVF